MVANREKGGRHFRIGQQMWKCVVLCFRFPLPGSGRRARNLQMINALFSSSHSYRACFPITRGAPGTMGWLCCCAIWQQQSRAGRQSEGSLPLPCNNPPLHTPCSMVLESSQSRRSSFIKRLQANIILKLTFKPQACTYEDKM